MRDRDRDGAGMLPLGEVWCRLKRNRRAMIGLVILLIIVLLAVFAPLIAPHDPHERHEGMGSRDEDTEVLQDYLPLKTLSSMTMIARALPWMGC